MSPDTSRAEFRTFLRAFGALPARKWPRVYRGADVWTVNCRQRKARGLCPVECTSSYECHGLRGLTGGVSRNGGVCVRLLACCVVSLGRCVTVTNTS